MAKQSEKLKLKSIEEEAKACRKAFEGVPIGTSVWHCHHEKFVEFLIEPAENRIAYILSSKPQHEQALRLHLFRPFNIKLLSKGLQKADADWQKAYADWLKADADCEKTGADLQKSFEKVHIKTCKNCPWNGETIFPN